MATCSALCVPRWEGSQAHGRTSAWWGVKGPRRPGRLGELFSGAELGCRAGNGATNGGGSS